MDHRVSIIIPAHNAAPNIRDTLDSVLRQSWADREVIVVDDGSSDGTAQMAEAYAPRGVRVIRQANRGAASARNRGYAESTGAYIQYLDADDLLSPEKIAIQVAALDGKPGYVASCRWGRFRHAPEETRWEDGPQFRDLSPPEYFRTYLASAGGAFMPCHAWLTPRELVAAAGPWNPFLTTNDDGDFFARVMLRARGVVFCGSAAVFYRQVPDSLSKPKNAIDVAPDDRGARQHRRPRGARCGPA